MTNTDNLTEEQERELVEELETSLGLGYPKAQEKQGHFPFFNKILKSTRENLSKVANLKDNEIGSIHELRKGSQFAETMGLNLVANFFENEADSYLSLTDSRAGFLVNASITKKSEVISNQKKKFKLFGGKNEQ